MEDRNHMIISIDAEKAFDKIQHPFMTETFNKVGREGIHLNVIKVVNNKAIVNIILNGRKLIRNKTRMPLSPLLFSIILEVPVTVIRKEKEIKSIKLERKK